MTIEQDELIKQLAETQAQLKEALEALDRVVTSKVVTWNGDAGYLVNKHDGQKIKEVLSRSADYSALDAAIEPYRLDAELNSQLLDLYKAITDWRDSAGYEPRMLRQDHIFKIVDQINDEVIDAAIARKG